MSIRTGTIRGPYRRVAILLMLTPMMLLNASQAMTLCVGHDGHVAVELLVQDHCVCSAPAPPWRGLWIDTTLDMTDGRDLSCTDLVVPIGACSPHPTPTPSQAVSLGLATTPPLLSSAPMGMSPSDLLDSSPPLARYYAPLNSIILRV